MLFPHDPTCTNAYKAELRTYQLNRVFTIALSLFVALLCFSPEFAFAAGGLSKANNGLLSFLSESKPLLHTLGVISIMLTAAAYMGGLVDKSKFIVIIAGLIIIGAAGDIVDIFYDGK